MSSYTHVVCCVDGTDSSKSVEARAARAADLEGARLSVVHVVSPSMVVVGDSRSGKPVGGSTEARLQDAQKWLDERASRDPSSAGVIIQSANAGEALCEWAKKNGASLLVVGQREGSILENLGSTANYVVRHAPCDILVVHGGD
ncbi:MAG: universal stress protein [Thermoleophilia bacterium]|nr:universal stress protein [Thermoleophilia bacterium]